MNKLSAPLEVAGLVLLSIAAFLVAVPLGLAVAGVSLFAVGFARED
jgi:hypothetical protein